MFGQKTPIFSLAKIIGGLSKTLNYANQIIPIYQNMVPVIENAKTTINKIKDFANTNAKKIVDNKNIKEVKEKINTIKDINLNKPTFFQ